MLLLRRDHTDGMDQGVKSGTSARQNISGKRLLYFSSVPYNSYAQRPHFMAIAFANARYDVLWVDPYPTRLPNLSDLWRVRGRRRSVQHATNSVRLYCPVALPIEPLPLGSLINHILCWPQVRQRLQDFITDGEHCVIGIGRPSALGTWALTSLPHQRSFIDVLDKFPEFYRGFSRISMARRLKAICLSVTDVFCSSTQLARDIRTVRRDALIVLNGYATDGLPEPSNPSFRTCIGYVGMIGHWFDWPLVREIASSLSNVTIRLIGPETVTRPVNLPLNIEFVGERPFTEVASLVREFAVGLIPFKINDLTEGVDPIKFYEYRSMGVPIWSTRFGEMRLRGMDDGVEVIHNGQNWQMLWHKTISTELNLGEILKFRKDISWTKRFDPIVRYVSPPRLSQGITVPRNDLSPLHEAKPSP